MRRISRWVRHPRPAVQLWRIWALGCLLLATVAPASGQTAPIPPEAGTAPITTAPREIDWHELLPSDQVVSVEEMIGDVDHSGGQASPLLDAARAVPAMDGATGTLTGYLVPIATDGQRRVLEMFLVPYYGACIHVPPPPANQIVYIRLDQPVPAGELWDAYRVTGKLRIARTANDLGDAIYAMDMQRLELIPESANRHYRWLADGIMIAVFLTLLFAAKAINRWDPQTRVGR